MKLQLMFAAVLLAIALRAGTLADEPPAPLKLAWADNLLSIDAPGLPGGPLKVNYLEAYCRAGSTDRDWRQTVIKHTTRVVSANADGRELALECHLADGVVVEHQIVARAGRVDFQLVARNPTEKTSEADWAQPCIRVAPFTGRTQQDYVPLCFVMVEGKVTPLPTEPWATKARYTPGQVYCPAGVNRNDVNPRPLSTIVPSHGLIGCFSGDGKWIMASAWEPYQELFQGVATCVHSDFRIGGLEPGKSKTIRGTIYLTRDSIASLVKQYERDYPEHLAAPAK